MARRRTNHGNTLLFKVVGIAWVAIVVIGGAEWLLAETISHPVAGVAAVLVIAGAVAGGCALWWQQRKRQQAAAHQHYQIQVARSQQIAPYHAMDAKEFEQALAFLCQRDGCTDVRVVGGAGDLGADVIATAPDSRRIVLQAKRYGPTSKVTGPDLQKFGGTCFNVHGAHVAAVVTTSAFTRQAYQYAGHMGIRLFDEQALAGWASRTGPAPWHRPSH